MTATASTRPTNGLAIASLICGIACWVVLPVVAGIGAVVTGHMARAAIARNNNTEEGDGMALAGLILGYSHLVLSCIAIGLIVAVFAGIIGAGLLHK